MNPLIRPIAHYLPGTCLVTHRGRRSGKEYRTVVTSYRHGRILAVALGHGETDWVKNVVAAGGADVARFGRVLHVTSPRIIPAGGDTSGLPWRVRVQGRRVAILVADIA
ncbi:nitroreductase family deazaflavin-dependent oxidoreductase [Gordonia shandongensis]|uniref:nitroreductase family deazaflavin-dependent oxidoreductase n=1 Tax=Gordonia shandongensis TaxID=376351 RepID=UPI0009FBF770|nr:nitroreductase family deazaflavin-dependent oxidoreductase [Gordonia shandongensis]